MEVKEFSKTTRTMSPVQRIYLIEDDPDLADIINESLTANDYAVFVNMGNYVSFSDILDYSPDMILIDWMLPNIQGIDVIKRIKENPETTHILCVLITGRDSESDKIAGYGTGVDAYVTKPFSMEMLLAVIANLTERKRSGEIAPQYRSDNEQETDDERFFQHFVRIVEKQYSDPDLCLDTITTLMHCSKSTLIKRLKKITDTTPYDYIKNYRMQRAMDLLTTENMYVTDVARKVGYRNLAVFSKAFKSTFGCSPKSYVNKPNQR